MSFTKQERPAEINFTAKDKIEEQENQDKIEKRMSIQSVGDYFEK